MFSIGKHCHQTVRSPSSVAIIFLLNCCGFSSSTGISCSVQNVKDLKFHHSLIIYIYLLDPKIEEVPSVQKQFYSLNSKRKLQFQDYADEPCVLKKLRNAS